MKTIEEMKNYLREHDLTSQVREFTRLGCESEAAIEYVYDAHTLSNDEFKAKYFR